MSEKGEKTCPLCTEEMDLTDLQLKPCGCGYEICVWCWNHIMEIAGRDKTEGRCPACRAPYDKERIVAMAADCGRLVAQMNLERKMKSQKVKPKVIEGRMHLSDVRVLRRNLAYIVGLPLTLADETLLQKKEYFSQYGKVLRVSISRTTNGAIQHSSNDCCCVYVTYSKEEEAKRCIQSVHSFVLDGRPLKAYFGTTKYCHTWLKNMQCNVPDCLYYHDLGLEEDRYSKEDLVSAFARSRVQQIIGATNNMHRPSSSTLPPPAEESSPGNISSMAEQDYRNSSCQNLSNWNSGSCGDGCNGQVNMHSGGTSWVKHVCASLPVVTTLSGSGGTPDPTPEKSSQQLSASEVESMKRSCDVKSSLLLPKESCELGPPYPKSLSVRCQNELPGMCENISASPAQSCLRLAQFSDTHLHEGEVSCTDRKVEGLCLGLSSIGVGGHHDNQEPDPVIRISVNSNHNPSRSPVSGQDNCDLSRESTHIDELLNFDDQQAKDFVSNCDPPYFPASNVTFEVTTRPTTFHSWNQSKICQKKTDDAHQSVVLTKHESVLSRLNSAEPVMSELSKNQAARLAESDKNVFSRVSFGKYSKAHDVNATGVSSNSDSDKVESSIITDILSMDTDTWSNTLKPNQSLLELLIENDKNLGGQKLPSLHKVRDSTQSRFSFARQDNFYDQVSNLEHSVENTIGRLSGQLRPIENQDLLSEKSLGITSNGYFGLNDILSSDPFAPREFPAPKSLTASSPPGFSMQNRAVPSALPHQTMGAFDHSAHHLLHGSFETMSPLPGSFVTDMELQMLTQQVNSAQKAPHLSDHLSRFSIQNDGYGVSPLLVHQSATSNQMGYHRGIGWQDSNLHMSNGLLGNELKNSNNMNFQELRVNGTMGFNKIIPSYDLNRQMPGLSNTYSSKRFMM